MYRMVGCKWDFPVILSIVLESTSCNWTGDCGRYKLCWNKQEHYMVGRGAGPALTFSQWSTDSNCSIGPLLRDLRKPGVNKL